MSSTKTGGIIASLIFLSSLLCFAQVAVAETVFYVDPNWSGSANGSASNPWRSLDSSAWATINSALASDSVTVYFSARAAGSDTDQTTTTSQLSIQRTNGSSRRLTLDGMSQYNTNDSSPSWAPYSGLSRFKITGGGAGISSSNFGTGTASPRNFITVRGFKVSGTDQGIVLANISNFILEYNDVSNTGPSSGAIGIQLASAFDGAPSDPGCPDACIGSFGRDIIIRNNTVHDINQEGIYIGGYYRTDNTLTTANAAFTNVTIENNRVENVGRLSEGNCIDVKDGNVNLVVRGNTCLITSPTSVIAAAIVLESCAVVERNFVANHSNGIALVAAYHSLLGRNGCEVRNNVLVFNNAGGDYDSGIELRGVNDNNTAYKWTNTKIYDNTIYGNPVGIQIPSAEAGHDNITVSNNIVAANTGLQLNAAAGRVVAHTNNLYFKSGGGTLVSFGGNSFNASSITSFEASAKAADPQLVTPTVAAGPLGFRLRSTSPALGAALTLGSFDDDFSGQTRVVPWDMGAWASLPPANTPNAPTGVSLR